MQYLYLWMAVRTFMCIQFIYVLMWDLSMVHVEQCDIAIRFENLTSLSCLLLMVFCNQQCKLLWGPLFTPPFYYACHIASSVQGTGSRGIPWLGPFRQWRCWWTEMGDSSEIIIIMTQQTSKCVIMVNGQQRFCELRLDTILWIWTTVLESLGNAVCVSLSLLIIRSSMPSIMLTTK